MSRGNAHSVRSSTAISAKGAGDTMSCAPLTLTPSDRKRNSCVIKIKIITREEMFHCGGVFILISALVDGRSNSENIRSDPRRGDFACV